MQTNIWWWKERDQFACGCGSREAQERKVQRGTKKSLGLMDIFAILIVVDMCVKTKTLHVKHVQFIV